MSREQLEALLGESEKAMQNLAVARKQSTPMALMGKQDRYGHTFKDDLQQNVMPPETQARLEVLKASATDDLLGGDLPGVQLKVSDLRNQLAVEIERFKAIIDYWSEVGSKDTAAPRGARTEKLRVAGIELPPHDKEAAQLEAQFDQQMAARAFTAAMRETWPRLSAAYRIAREEESQEIISLLDSGGLKGAPSAAPTKKCVPAKETSKQSLPAIRIRDFPISESYYPASLKRNGTPAAAEVFVVVSADGCPERSVIIGPSGYAEVDANVARYAVDGSYLPAEKDGAAIRSGFSFRTEFRIPH